FIRLVSISEPRSDGTRVIYLELNGQSREIVIRDKSVKIDIKELSKADNLEPKHVGATMTGTVIKTLCSNGDKVNKGDYLLITGATKMETTFQPPFKGVIKEVHVDAGAAINVNDLLIQFE